MTRMLLRFIAVLAVCSALFAAAQSAATASPAPSTPAPAPANPSTATPSTGTKVGTINVEQAVVACNEGQRDFGALQKKLEPKQTELQGQNDELDALQKQLQTQQDKLNAEALANLQKQIETKKKSFDRAVQDAQEDAGNQQKEIFQRILQKMGPVIVKYAQDNGIGMIVDTSNPWPQGPVLWAGDSMDITKPVVEAYNVQSGVAAPAAGATKPAVPKPTAAKPAAPKPAAPKSSESPK
ncbi:MAG TPA: OmpH family outer membrane protein [Candidatus Sulfotelmatobacter sp.]|nr:OmpH family outer membrane protein [Candidatus Sulfotelmatobacter sp.]